MAIRNIIEFNNAKFLKKSREVVNFDEKLHELLADMLETLRSVGGYGLAAVHVGVLKRVILIDHEEGVIEIINPVVVEVSPETQHVMEGSISKNAPRGEVIRPKGVKVTGFDRFGQEINVSGEDFFAATLCHEIDHLDGILFSHKIV